MRYSVWSLAFTVALMAADASGAEEVLQILPQRMVLHGSNSRQRFVVERMLEGRAAGDVTGQAELVSSDPEIVAIENGVAVPAGDGEAEIVARWDGNTATALVTVEGTGRPAQWSFRNHVQSVLTKAGCNSGACHGAAAGKGGMKLSLRGYDTPRDHLIITRQARGRRVELADPGRSLILAKPTGALPHKGGVRLEVGSLEYRVLSQWLASGAPPPDDSDPRLVGLELLPDEAVLQTGDVQQFLVRAQFSDGHEEDVTQWVKFTATDEAVAKVDSQGRVSVVGHGEGAVTAWYLSRIVIGRVRSPYPTPEDELLAAETGCDNFIDRLVADKLSRLRLPASPAAADSERIRRVHLDTIGRLPDAEQVLVLLEDSSPLRWERLIDRLLARPEFVDYWTYRWSDLFLVNGNRLRPDAVKSYYGWIRHAVAEDRRWDELARQMVTARGSSFEHGATNFFALHQDPLEMAENTTMAFLGLNINCARCHNHPLEKWTNDQYYALANLFARVRAKGWGGEPRSGDGLRSLYVVPDGELIQPRTGEPQPPTPLDGVPLAFDAPGDRREHLADWLTSPDNPYFARAITNRIWGNFFGVGIVEPVDDLRASNPASNEELLAAASAWLVRHEFHLKPLMRAILLSRTYHRSSQSMPGNRSDTRFYSRYYPKRLMAEVLLDAICDVTAVPSQFTELELSGAGERVKIEDYAPGTRAIQLRDSAVASYFLKTFGRNERMITCECERSNEPSMVQVLHLSNGDTINQKLSAGKGRITNWLAAGTRDEAIVDEAYLTALSRFPGVEEKGRLCEALAQAESHEKREVVEDLLWALLSSREFLFNH
jgi:hypothetical protein